MRKIIFLIILISFISLVSPAHAYWIWSPKTGKWINPKYVVKPTPQEQLKFAQSFLEKKDYERALIEFRALIKNYPKAFEAAEAQFSMGICLENMDKPYEAYLAYQKMIDKYPFSDKINDALKKEFDIADEFINGKKRKFAGVPLPVENPAIEILRKVIENSTYGPLAPIAQYKLGLLFKALTRYQEAQEEFEKVIANYPESEWAEPAKFQIAVALAKVSPSGKYDENTSLEAKKRFQDFVRTHPDAELSEEALKEIDRITEKQAENNFHIARFYEKQHAWEAAKIYYNTVINDFSRSAWVVQALERVKVVEKFIEEKNKKAKPLTKEEKQVLREKKKLEKEERVEEIKAEKETKIREKKQARDVKKSEREDRRQEKLENAKKLKEENQAKKEAKIQSIKEKQETKQKSKAELLEKKKAENEIKKQTKQKTQEKKKAEKEAKPKEKTERLQKIKEEKEAKRQAKIETAKEKRAKGNKTLSETPKVVKKAEHQEIQTQTIEETKNTNLEVPMMGDVSEENPQDDASQVATSTANQDSGPQIETRPKSEGIEW